MIRIGFPLALGVALFAASIAPTNAQPIPSGSYQQSCNDIHVSDGRLFARCTKDRGRRVRSSIALADCRHHFIANSNGHLVCGALRHGQR
jgi:hypothetical protein